MEEDEERYLWCRRQNEQREWRDRASLGSLGRRNCSQDNRRRRIVLEARREDGRRRTDSTTEGHSSPALRSSRNSSEPWRAATRTDRDGWREPLRSWRLTTGGWNRSQWSSNHDRWRVHSCVSSRSNCGWATLHLRRICLESTHHTERIGIQTTHWGPSDRWIHHNSLHRYIRRRRRDGVRSFQTDSAVRKQQSHCLPWWYSEIWIGQIRRFGNTISLRNPSETSTTRSDPYSSNREIDYLRHTRVFKSVPK